MNPSEDAASGRKRSLLTAWIQAGPVRVFFDSGYSGVQIPEHLSKDPEMWVSLVVASVAESGVSARIAPPDAVAFEVYIPWAAVHTLESAPLREIHVWGDDIEAAEERKRKGYPKEMKN